MPSLNLHHLNPEPVPPKVLKQILEDTVLMEKLSDRVYQLIRDDLKYQRERKLGYGRQR